MARVIESLHLVAPFLAPADLLRLSGASRGWTRAYRGAVGELRCVWWEGVFWENGMVGWELILLVVSTHIHKPGSASPRPAAGRAIGRAC